MTTDHATPDEPRPGDWVSIQTDAGWHLGIIGANGEPVVTSEVYTEEDAVLDARLFVERTVRLQAGQPNRYVDRRGQQS